MKYTRETLKKINGRFCGTHYDVDDSDVKKANEYVELIELTRSKTQPKAGDILILTDKYGNYYPHAHIEKVIDWEYWGGNVCESAQVPFISKRNDGISCSTSGGAWQTINPTDMKYVGRQKKTFCDWGHCGACADGAIEFEAEVSVWVYKDPECGEYTTKDYEKFYVSDSGEDSDYTKRTGYRWHVSRGALNHRAFKTREEYDAWLRTFRGVVQKGNWNNQEIVWAFKEVRHGISPSEYDSLDLPEDTMMMNGLRLCKRKYDEEKHEVHTYFVWYWDEPGDWQENAMKQNEIRKKYEIDWREGRKEFELARKELER